MGILDWFKNRPLQFDPDRRYDDMTLRAIDKAVSLTNPGLKIVRSYQERLAPAVEISINFIREMVLSLPQPIKVSAAYWFADPVLRAFFATASDIPHVLGRSSNLRTLIDKYPMLDEVYFILVMTFNELRVLGMSLQDSVVQRDVAQTVIGFSDHEARICGNEDQEVRRLFGTQTYEYLVAQAMSKIGEQRSERRELHDNCSLIRARLRLLQQQGPGLGTVFGSAPVVSAEKLKLEEQLEENERQIQAIGRSQSALNAELETLREVLEHPERYIHVEQKQVRISTMNVVLDQASTDVASDIGFSLAQLKGVPQIQRAFVLARFARTELPEARMNFDDAVRYL